MTEKTSTSNESTTTTTSTTSAAPTENVTQPQPVQPIFVNKKILDNTRTK